MKVLILGASGIVGQFMRQQAEHDPTLAPLEIIYARREVDRFHTPLDCGSVYTVEWFLERTCPDVIVNLAGVNAVDLVEEHARGLHVPREDMQPPRLETHAHDLIVNVGVPAALAVWCGTTRTRLIQVSSQAVFGGEDPPYGPDDLCYPVNEYGRQKRAAEVATLWSQQTLVARLTFVLGVRPYPWGRVNPLERMLEAGEQSQVSDRWFSPCFAADAAEQLWELVLRPPTEHAEERRIVHIGTPVRTCRYEIATVAKGYAGQDASGVRPVRHDEAFPDLAPRPLDTTYAEGARHRRAFFAGLRECVDQWLARRHEERLRQERLRQEVDR